MDWLGQTSYIETEHAAKEAVICKLAECFRKAEIPFMVVKGWAVSRWYPAAGRRSFCDVDFYNFGFQKEADCLVEAKLGVKVDEDIEHHTTFCLDGVHCENHYDFVNTQTHMDNVDFEQTLKREAEKDFEVVSMEGSDVRVPSAQFDALFLMRHTAMHFACEVVTLKYLCDWTLFVEKNGKAVDWQEVLQTYNHAGMKRFADAFTRLCVRHMGLDASCMPQLAEDKALENRIMQDILSGGFSEIMPHGRMAILSWKIRRYHANGWKQNLVYSDNAIHAIWQSVKAHLKKPGSIFR